jgi:pimeloyl-ACP methyl ester carboxylesterase
VAVLVLVGRYRWPSLKTGWDRTLARFCLAPLSVALGGVPVDHGDAHPSTMEGLLSALKAGVDTGAIKLLVIHGTYDPIVPASNSRRLVQLLGSRAKVSLVTTPYVKSVGSQG